MRVRACRPSLSGEASHAHTVRALRLVPRARARHANRYFVAYSKTRARTLPTRQADFSKTADGTNAEITSALCTKRLFAAFLVEFCYFFFFFL